MRNSTDLPLLQIQVGGGNQPLLGPNELCGCVQQYFLCVQNAQWDALLCLCQRHLSVFDLTTFLVLDKGHKGQTFQYHIFSLIKNLSVNPVDTNWHFTDWVLDIFSQDQGALHHLWLTSLELFYNLNFSSIITIINVKNCL